MVIFNTLLTIIGVSSLVVLFVAAEPLIKLKHKMFSKQKNYEFTWYWKLLNCALCSGFWIGLISTQDMLIAAIISILSEILYQKINGSI